MNVTSHRSRWLSFFAILLAVILLYFAMRRVEWGELWRIIQNARLEYLVLGCLLTSATSMIRALRWRVLLSAERWLGVLDVFWATMVGYLGNSFLPARAGEVLRSVALGRRSQISSSFVLATALTERILDAGILVIIGSIALGMLDEGPPSLLNASNGMAVLSAVGLAVVFFLPFLKRQIEWILNRLPLPVALKIRLRGLLEQFLLGLRSLRHSGRALSFLVLAAVIWLGDAIGATIIAHALGLSLTIPQALLLGVSLGLSSAIPSTPGYIGVYQFVAVTVLPIFGLTVNQALAFILVYQALSYLVITWWGLLGLWRLKLFGRQVNLALKDDIK